MVTDLGEVEQATLNYWADKTIKFAFKVLRHAKAASLVMEQSSVDKDHIDMAFSQLTKGQQRSVNNMSGNRRYY